MTSFLSIQNYSPILVLAAGLATFVGLWGLGMALLSLIQLRLPSPWNHVTAILLGIQTLSLAVQIAGIAEIASSTLLRTIWWSLVVFGASILLIRARLICIQKFPIRQKSALLPIAIMGAAIAANTLVALAPSTKIDELYCYMLIPSRIVFDGAIRFYREPWQGAIWPQMVYQISAAPTHAIGYPDAANVVSCALSATLAWFAWKIIRSNSNTVLWTALCVASICVGIYPTVFHVTGGAHAMGDLALAGAIVALCFRARLLESLTLTAYSALFSFLLLCAASSKVSLLPLSVLLLFMGLWPLMKSVPRESRGRVAMAVALPWLVFSFPIAWWTLAQSGSPFGPIRAGMFESSVYSDAWLENTLQREREITQLPSFLVRNATLGYSPLIWFGVIGALFTPRLATATRGTLGILLVFQCLLIFWLLPYDVRYLSIHYGLFIVFATLGPRALQERLSSVRVVFVACSIFLIPWLAIQIYFAKQFLAVSSGLERGAFYKRYVAFYSDYVELDRLLPRETVLLAPRFHLSAVYAPRPIFFDEADLPPGRPVALLVLRGTIDADETLNEYKIGDQVYENSRAVVQTYRTPGRAPKIGSLEVVFIEK